jgi:cell division protein FtsQ
MARKVKSKAKRGTRKSTLNKRRKGALSIVMPWMRRFGVALCVVVFTIWIGAWLWLNGSVQSSADWTNERMLVASANAGFRVENIMVEGRDNASADVILAIINMEKGDPLFAFDPEAAKAQLEKISWVDDAHVERRLPDTLYIGLNERTPLALWRKGGALKLLDAHGEVIAVNDLSPFKGLMTVSGKGATRHLPELVANLAAEPAVHNRVIKAVRISERRWDLTLDNNITVKLPEEDLGLSFRRLAQAQEDSALLDKDIAAIDLREADRMAVRAKSGKAQDYVRDFVSGGAKNNKTGNDI